MKTRSFLVQVVVLLVLGTLVAEAAIIRGEWTSGLGEAVKGQDPVKGQDRVRGRLLTKRGSCPRVLIRCAMMNPPNRCLRDAQCPGAKKCCEGSCGKTCMDPQ
uniref:WAP domain-containing protein n=1 Tax=Capra hircus TaxID=9925 RepID=A0A8C2P795_CAPHI